MPFVTVEVDIAANGSIQATPNPVRVRSGQKLFFHVNSNTSKKKRFSVTFPGGPQSPFGEGETTVDVAARRCLGGGAHVDWPRDVHHATVRLAAHSSPASDFLDLEVLRDDTMLLTPASGGQQIVQNFYMNHGVHHADLISAGPQSAQLLERKSTDCGPPVFQPARPGVLGIRMKRGQLAMRSNASTMPAWRSAVDAARQTKVAIL